MAEAIPDYVLDSVRHALHGYNERAAQVRYACALARNPLVGGGRRYLDEYRAKVEMSSTDDDRDMIREFLALAATNGVDGRAIVRALASEVLTRRDGDPLRDVRSRRQAS